MAFCLSELPNSSPLNHPNSALCTKNSTEFDAHSPRAKFIFFQLTYSYCVTINYCQRASRAKTLC